MFWGEGSTCGTDTHLYHIVGLSMLMLRIVTDLRINTGGLDGMGCVICSLEKQNGKGCCHESDCLTSWNMQITHTPKAQVSIYEISFLNKDSQHEHS